MADVIEIAKERRAKLAAEVDRLDEFIQMAEQLVSSSEPESNEALETENKTVRTRDETTAEPVNEAPPWPVLGAADEDDFDDDKTPARELKADEQVLNLIAKEKAAAPERRGIFRRAPP